MKNFTSFGGFAAHLVRLMAEAPTVLHHAADRAAQVVLDDARDRVGFYQDRAGPFAAWAPLAERTMAERVRLGFTPNDPLLRTGELYASLGKTVDGASAVIGSTSQIMVWQELGTDRIPPRPVLGAAGFAQHVLVMSIAGSTAAAWLAGANWRRPSLTALGGMTRGGQ